MRVLLKRWWLVLLLLLALGAGGFVLWANTPLAAQPEALAALRSDDHVLVTTNRWMTFRPATISPALGLVLYPGGRVDARAYAPTARAIAEAGYLVVITPMPLNLAVLDPGRAASVMAAHPEIDVWAIGGHSLGGAMAANFVYRNPDAVDGLVLWAAYPADNNALAGYEGAVASIYGTRDGLATPEKIAASRALLPSTTRWVEIAGGNHAQFGWYGVQTGDYPATITHEMQQEAIIEATLALLDGLE